MKDAERALRRLDGVRDIEADIGGMTVKVKTAPDRTVDLASLRQVLASEGVRMRKLRILADGDVESAPSGSRFRIRGWPESYALRGKQLPAGPASLRATVHVESGSPVLHIE